MKTALARTWSWRLLQVSCLAFYFSLAGTASAEPPKLEDGLRTPYPAHLLIGITSWINSPPLSLSSLKGKVVLIEFWTSSCPYCQNALPYLNEWYNRYHNRGLVIIGVHSPKEEYEKSSSVVKQAVFDNHIKYPVALDNNFETWINYDVNGWPASYLIDKNGDVVYVKYGAEDFNVTENNIKALLNFKE